MTEGVEVEMEEEEEEEEIIESMLFFSIPEACWIGSSIFVAKFFKIQVSS